MSTEDRPWPPKMDEWPMTLPVNGKRMDQLLKVFGDVYVHNSQPRFEDINRAYIPKLLPRLKEVFAGPPEDWNGALLGPKGTRYKIRCLKDACERLDLCMEDLPYWLREDPLGRQLRTQLTRFQIIEDWV